MMLALTALLAVPFCQDETRIQQLIRQLGADDYAAREQATQELQKIGKPAEEALKKAAAESEDPEVRRRAKSLLEAAPRPERPRTEPAPPRAPPLVPRVRGSSVTVRSINGDSTYTITPGDGGAPITFHKTASGRVKLEYADEKGAAQTAESETIEKFLKDHKDLAQKFGITEKGIEFGGGRVGFSGQGGDFLLRKDNFALPPRAILPREEGDLVIAGARLEKVSEALRSQLQLPEGGAVVTRVTLGSAADLLGIRKSDILLEIDGQKVELPESCRALLPKAGSAVVMRRGQKETLRGRKDF